MKTALIIEDDRIMQYTLEKLLKKINVDVLCAENGIEGIKTLRKESFDFILLDLIMPKFDGEQVLTVLSKLDDAPPVIVISGHLTKERIIKLNSLGVKGFLSKPLDAKTFYLEIHKICPLDRFLGNS